METLTILHSTLGSTNTFVICNFAFILYRHIDVVRIGITRDVPLLTNLEENSGAIITSQKWKHLAFSITQHMLRNFFHLRLYHFLGNNSKVVNQRLHGHR